MFLHVIEIIDRLLIETLKKEQNLKVIATICLGIAKLTTCDINVRLVSTPNLMLA